MVAASSVVIDVVRCRRCLASLTKSVGEHSQETHVLQPDCVRKYGTSELSPKRTRQVSECAAVHHALDQCDVHLAVRAEK